MTNIFPLYKLPDIFSFSARGDAGFAARPAAHRLTNPRKDANIFIKTAKGVRLIMKKMAALLMALCLALSAAALAEGMETEIIENKPSYKGNYVGVSLTELCFCLPGDWDAAEAPDGVNGDVYCSKDGKFALTVVVSGGNLDDLAEQYAVAAEDGTLKDSRRAVINGREWLRFSTADGIQHYFQTQMDDSRILSFVYATAKPGDEPKYAAEMVGSLKEK